MIGGESDRRESAKQQQRAGEKVHGTEKKRKVARTIGIHFVKSRVEHFFINDRLRSRQVRAADSPLASHRPG
jgi:hypothetical protein